MIVPFPLRKLNFEETESTFQRILKDQERISAMRIAEKYTVILGDPGAVSGVNVCGESLL